VWKQAPHEVVETARRFTLSSSWSAAFARVTAGVK
jgi:hypothetical protein